MQKNAEADGDRDHPGHQFHPGDVFLHHEQRQHDGRETAWPEPSDVRHRGQPEHATREREGHRHHPDEGEAKHRVHNDSPVQVFQRGAEQHRPEDQKADRRQKSSEVLGEIGRPVRPFLLAAGPVPAQGEPAGEPGNPGGDEATAVRHDRESVRRSRNSQQIDLPPLPCDPAPGPGPLQ